MICRDCVTLNCPFRSTDATKECHFETEHLKDVGTGKLIYLPSDSFDVVAFRCNAAKDFVVGMLAHAHRYHPRNPKETDWHKAIVEEGIELADELIKQLNLLLPQ